MLFVTIATFSLTVDQVHPEKAPIENFSVFQCLELVAVSNFDTVKKMFLFSDPFLFDYSELDFFNKDNLTISKETYFNKQKYYSSNTNRISLFKQNNLVKETSRHNYTDAYFLQIIPKNLQSNFFLLKHKNSLSRNQFKELVALQSDFLCFKLKK